MYLLYDVNPFVCQFWRDVFFYCILCICSIDFRCRLVWTVDWFRWHFVVGSLSEFRNIHFHSGLNPYFLIIPFKIYACAQFAFPVCSYSIIVALETFVGSGAWHVLCPHILCQNHLLSMRTVLVFVCASTVLVCVVPHNIHVVLDSLLVIY